MVWRPSDKFWRAAGTALSGSFTSSQRGAVGGGRSLRADTTRCSTCRETSLHCCCSGRNVPETAIGVGGCMRNERKVAVITGASQGIGAALVNAYRDRNYRVVATARSLKPSNDDEVLAVPGDIADRRTA